MLQLACRPPIAGAPLLVALVALVASHRSAYAQVWLDRYEARTTRYTSNQPRWAGPVITTVPMLVQVFRYDVQRPIAPNGATWNLGLSKGLQLVPLPRLEFDITPPPFFLRDNNTPNGFGDLGLAAKYRIAAADEQHGNYIVTALLSAAVPTGTNRNGNTDATITPQLIAGKGRGRFDVVLAANAILPTGNTQTLGRTVNINAVAQYHLARYLWPELEANTTTWSGSARDGEVQTFLAPGIILGRLPYTRHEVNRRRGISIGAAFQTAITSYHTYNHNLVITTRLHF